MKDVGLFQPGESELEAAMRLEFFSNTSPVSFPGSQDEKSPDHSESTLAELERLMREEFFPRAQTSERYVYRPFQSKNCIRLLQLLPGSRDDPIQGSLLFASFDSNPDYEALSYAWGSSDMHYHICTDDGTIPVTASVHSALTRLRLQDRIRMLWIDALCINQKDNNEKSEQILLMPKIYALASRAVVHLGEEADRSDLVIKLIQKIAMTNFFDLSGSFVSESALPEFGLPHGRKKIWKDLRSFWARPWFRRIWVMQEFTLAKDVTMICGDWEGNWKIFLDAALKINNYRLWLTNTEIHRADVGLNACAGIMLMLQMCSQRLLGDDSSFRHHQVWRLTHLLDMGDNARREVELGAPFLGEYASVIQSHTGVSKMVSNMFCEQRQNPSFDPFMFFNLERPRPGPRKPQGAPLIDLLRMMEAAEASEPRDRLFALLSLADDLNEEERQLLRPDYQEPVKSIFCRYASLLVRKGHGMEILYTAFLEPEPYGLPSWAGNWITPVLPLNKKAHLTLQKPKLYRAGGDSKPKIRMGDEGDVVIVCGGIVDTIDRVGYGPIMQRIGGMVLPMAINLALNDVDAIFETLSLYPTGESLDEVKWRTLIANRMLPSTHQEPPDWYGDVYRAWREEIKSKFFTWTEEEVNTVAPKEYAPALAGVSSHKLCRTQGGYVGQMPTSAEVGDHICVLPGGIVPFVIRDSVKRPGMFRMVGQCYIHGMMKGEAFKLPHWKEVELMLY